MTVCVRVFAVLLLLAAISGCNRRPDPMSIVQSPAEYNCLTAVGQTTNSRKVTLLALARTESGAEAQVLSEREGTVWTCRTSPEGVITSLRPGLGSNQ
jgi:hypothetical protein